VLTIADFYGSKSTLLQMVFFKVPSRVSQVNDMKPDMIFLLGDICEGHGENIEAFMPALQKFSAPLGIWSVNGNHENHGKKRDLNSSFTRAKIVTLQDECIEVTPGLLLAGRNTIHNRNEAQANQPWNPPQDHPAGSLILLSHVPENYQDATVAGVDLMLSGHTHSGQLWPFNHLVAIAHPKLQGRYEVDGMTLLVTRGAGTWGPRMRLWQPSEILHVTLRSE
jgi:predicted MPP superfamily phosphohydrolase